MSDYKEKITKAITDAYKTLEQEFMACSILAGGGHEDLAIASEARAVEAVRSAFAKVRTAVAEEVERGGGINEDVATGEQVTAVLKRDDGESRTINGAR